MFFANRKTIEASHEIVGLAGFSISIPPIHMMMQRQL